MKNTGFKNKPRKPLTRSPFKRPEKSGFKPRKPKTKASKKRSKKGEWSCKTADTKFSHFIRERDMKCKKCGTTENLTCSHFWGRSCSSVRFDPDNCDALCWGPNGCHQYWEDLKNHEYKEYMVKKLGQAGYDALELRARTFKKRSEAIAEFKTLYETL